MTQENEINIDIGVYDYYFYIGPISMDGYYRLCKEINTHKSKEKVMLCLVTYGGDPDAGFRIGRALQHHYNSDVSIYIPNVCKSAGTLTVISAKTIIMNNQGELGPLDIQLRKDDELGVSNSGLDIFKTLDTLEERVNAEFTKYLRSVRFGQGLSTRMSADIATKLVSSIIKPIAEQIDPIKIGEHQRATDIATEYGSRLNETSQCLKNNKTSLEQLIRGYPSHGFVIDRKEAQRLFSCVQRANEDIIKKFKAIHDVLELNPKIASSGLFIEYLKEEKENEHSTNSERKGEYSSKNSSPNNGNVEGVPTEVPSPTPRKNSRRTN
ncbi:TPA: SDH family Clp fold serine proteinase [Haemophilus influenzae]|uniref:SDH family Clp fold serine proteinase n=1 Tax=Haemophilus influenzae TaxID=727 RepID=UPI000D4829E7|nr:SppA protein [Haemophilus influenzae]AXP38268.1 SppA protein [Haemophilus influenzae]AXP66815.1 SppA protein [Haemophilus influenzae]AYO34886.1 SppA protein [Haemophilus influenzae]MCK9649555.1 SppA protein [Haemophilus influenzae]MCK9651229.1 SppA protein [Haemophilus influenzae]